MSVNLVILIGRLGSDPELKDAGNKKICKFSLATNRSWKNEDGSKKEETTWHRIVCWGKRGEAMAQYLSRGQQVYIEGRINNTVVGDGDDKKYYSDVVVESFTFIGSKSDAAGDKEGDLPF